MKTLMAVELGLAILLSGSFAAYAQTADRRYHVHHSYPSHHAAHHHAAARSAAQARAPAAERPGGSVESAPLPLTNQMFKPYAHPGEGDDDGLSRDPDDCMKGCIGGNPG